MSTTTTTTTTTVTGTSIETKIFTCLACEVAFPTSERQRSHYRTDWHKYNLKRKMAHLSALSAEQFTEKVLAQQERNRLEQEKQGSIYECLVCRKSYLTENAYNNHITSKKHSELLQEQKTDNVTEHIVETPTVVEKTVAHQPTLDCLFCNLTSNDLEANLSHMTHKHSFFLPDVEYLKDTEGLIHYLSDKINTSHLCLYCNGRGKTWHSAAAVRAHMVDSGHCKLAYDETEDPEELLKYYDFELQDSDAAAEDHNGTIKKLGHRTHKKHLITTKKTTVLPRQRHHVLAITDGTAQQDNKKTAEGIREFAKNNEFVKKLSLKQNENQLFRLRIQNPI